MDQLDDIHIIENVLSGNSDQFRVLVQRYERRILRLTYRYLGDHEEMQDAAQETFVRAFRSLRSYNSQYAFGTWLDRIAVNVCKTRYSKARRIQDNEAEEEDQGQTPDEAEGPEEIVRNRELRRSIRHAVDRLPRKLREVVILYYLEERSIPEAAEILSISRENIKSRLHRARKKLAGYLADDATD